jgi:hypothetical protein
MRVRRLTARDAIARSAALPALGAAAAIACASPAPGPGESPDAIAPPPAEPDAVRIRLVFGAEADLDLYVLGPAQEAVYFANGASSDGGRLVADRRCDAPAPRVETVEFAHAGAGRYRVGVDFMIRCSNRVDRARYELIAEVPGKAPIRVDGEAAFGVFDPRTLEFDLRTR